MLVMRLLCARIGNISMGILLLVLSFLPTESMGFNIAQAPLFMTAPVPPLVMLTMSRDQQLHFTAFPDYADLNNDGLADQGYLHSVDYYGYFDSYKCYAYSSTANKFSPSRTTVDKYCNGSEWSGNFLNWVSMARIDIVRKILYGGYRYTDPTDANTATVLERTYLPNDAHSWVKYYAGTDINKLTPFLVSAVANGTTSYKLLSISTASSVRSNSANLITPPVISWNSGDASEIGDQLYFYVGNSSFPISWMMGVYMGKATTGSGINETTVDQIQITGSSSTVSGSSVLVGNTITWNVINSSRNGVSFCNTTSTTNYSNTVLSQDAAANTTAYPPLIRVAKGNYSLWAANERYQCLWDTEKSRTGYAALAIDGQSFSNSNMMSVSQVTANSDNPVKSDVALGLGDYVVRVDSCVNSLLNQEKCKKYPSGNQKPIGLIQQYGDDSSLYFGLLTGSYSKNMSGGVLRKNIGVITDEINAGTDGTVKVPINGSIINSLDRLSIYGYRSGSDGTYFNVTGSDSCTWGLSSFTEGNCSNWGNPQSEIFLEALRYYAGLAATSSFSMAGNDKITGLTSASWADPLTINNRCAPLNIINFNASVSSYDSDGYSSVPLSWGSVTTLTDTVGVGEGIDNKPWFIGTLGGTPSSSDLNNNQLCTAKLITSLGSVTGPCPEAPRLSGSYRIAGLANYAYTNDLRSSLDGNQMVKTFGVSLAPAVPRIVIPTPGNVKASVVILPACRNSGMTPNGNCTIVDFKIINQDLTAGTGSFLVVWEDSEQGGDYDQDMTGLLSYRITSTRITVTTQVLTMSTSFSMGFGYIISGTTQDGFHAHSGILSYTYSDSTGAKACGSGGASCVDTSPATSQTYSLSTSGTANLLKDSLYYAAKWGGYDKTLVSTNDPTKNVKSWDSNGDGIPDNYYYAINPADLANNLAQVFQTLSDQIGSAAAVASDATVQQTGDAVYQAQYQVKDWSGELLRYDLDPVTNAPNTASPHWRSHNTQTSINPSTRKVYTWNGTTGIELLWSNLTSVQQNALIGSDTTSVGQDRLNWLRGDQSKEWSQSGGTLRDRIWLLGDIINSTPFYDDKTNMVYVGANDGGLHGFDSTTGLEQFVYIPNAVFSNLSALTNRTYIKDGHKYFVDGSPIVVDVGTDSILVATTGAGGRAVFALNVSDPANFTGGNGGDVLWEYTNTDLGYTIGQPKVGQLKNGEWVVVFGNGYNSNSGLAYLFIVDLNTGALVKKISTNSSASNGLTSPSLLLDSTDGRIIAAYAGDALGNMWKFDLSASSPTSIPATALFSGTPLFTAKNSIDQTQPITSAPAIMRHPNGGYFILFGAGKYFEVGDHATSIPTQSFYGVWDTATWDAINGWQGGATITATGSNRESILLRQQITNKVTTLGNTWRVVTNNAIDWSIQRGWYLDFTTSGERVTASPIVNGGRVVFAARIPYDNSDPCAPSVGVSWLMALDALSGSRSSTVVFDVNRDGQYNSSDTISVSGGQVLVSGFEAGVAGMSQMTLLRSSNGVDVVLSGTSGLSATASATQTSGQTNAVGTAIIQANTSINAANTANTAASANPSDTNAAAAANAANKQAAQDVVAAAQAIINAANDPTIQATIDAATLSNVITAANLIISEATPCTTSGCAPQSDWLQRLSDLKTLLQGKSNVGVRLSLLSVPSSTWRQLR